MSFPPRSSRTNVNPPEVPTPGIAGGEKLKAVPCGSLAELLVQAFLDGLELLRLLFAVRPRLQGDKEEGVVTGLHVAQQAEADDAGRVLDAGRFGENRLNLSARLDPCAGAKRRQEAEG